MKKIAVVTYHCSPNVGAILQTYALCRYLKEHGFDVEVVDIRNFEPNLKTISEGSPLPVRLLKSIIYPRRIKKIFTEYYPSVTRHYTSIDDLRDNAPDKDFYIVGSDQVWNHNISRDKTLAYFLDFGTEKVKRLSYASSFGLSKWECGKYATTDAIQKCLDKFIAISVREIEGKRILKETFHHEATIVLDPTFLNEDYPELTGKIRNREEIVCYKLEKTTDFWENIPVLSQEMEKPALLLNYNYPKKGFKYHFNPTVRQWVSRIAGAAFVITDSFHGVAFSIIYKKQFVAVINHNGKESRISSILKLLHLECRMFDKVEDVIKSEIWLKPINYTEVESYLNEMKKQSKDFLINALNS